MAALHSALQALRPASWDEIPKSKADQKSYLSHILQQAYLVAESVPQPVITDPSPVSSPKRQNTAGSRACADAKAPIASSISEITPSSARSPSPKPEYEILRKEWGKPITLRGENNTQKTGFSCYKMSSKDGKGTWFARRSVHNGLGFARWKGALEREFYEGIEHGGPGKGNVRDIGPERQVECIEVDDIGKVQVFHLSTQFPGPTVPRDFVTLLLSSASDVVPDDITNTSTSNGTCVTRHPRCYVTVSKPCSHSDCLPRDGFIRGEYESMEMIREIPRACKGERTMSFNPDVFAQKRRTKTNDCDCCPLQDTMSPNIDRQNVEQSQMKDEVKPSIEVNEKEEKIIDTPEASSTSTKRDKGKANADDDYADFDDEELNPVEWIMITRSDPGGSVPKWLVERSTPSSIVQDALRFLGWAVKRKYKYPEPNCTAGEEEKENKEA